MMTRGRGGGVWLPPENDDVIYEQPLIHDALNAGLNLIMVEKELHSARVGKNHFLSTNEIHRFVLCQVKPSVIRDHIKMISRVWSSLLCALVNTKQASFTVQVVSISEFSFDNYIQKEAS